MKRTSSLFVFLGLTIVAAPVLADAGDVGTADAGMASDVGSADAAGEAHPDVSISVDAGPIRRRQALFVGEVSVQFRGEDGGVKVTLNRTDGDLERQVRTDAGGRFEFRELPLGEYEVRLELDGYGTREETFELTGDREKRYDLYRDVDFTLRARASVPDGADADRVSLELVGGPGENRSTEVPVDEGSGTWELDELPVGNWTLRAEAGDLDPVETDFQVRPEGADEPVTTRLYLRTPEDVPPPSDSGCGCDPDPSSAGGRGGARPGGAFPTGPAAVLLVFGLWRIRWRLAADEGSRRG